jgi:hypothetical protein
MMLYVELWQARPAWLALPQEERERFFGIVGQALEAQFGAGCELAGVALNDVETPRRGNYQFMAVWKVPASRLPDFEATWERIGWHEYFAQENVRGPLIAPETFIERHIGL